MDEVTVNGQPEPEPPVSGALATLRPDLAELWERSGGSRDVYARLLREAGHVLKPGDEGYEDAPQWPECGWKPEGSGS